MTRLSTNRWGDVQRVLEGALQREDAEVGGWLDRECGSDHALREEVEELLQSCARAGAFLEEPPAGLAAALLEENPAPARRRIGPYLVTGEAGRGGMGIVYLAERDDGQFRQRVALKVLPGGLESDLAVRRFLEERQILASLAHPGIARLLDGGVTDDELPYFAMEYVEGTWIDRYCDEHRLDVEGRLRIFVEVCDAVQYAHQNLVVHRDLKPSNILVTGDGAIKLLDFGIAKLVSPEGAGDAGGLGEDPTRTGGRWLTPRYASPEQISGKPVTTVSDVYTLGILLYELVTGRSPYRLTSLTPVELPRAVCEEEVTRPSVAVLRRDAVANGDPTEVGREALARARAMRPERLARRLRGDIDTIVLTALQKEPARRYPSAGALAEDVRRHLGGRPVRARRDTLAYRTSKFVRRHMIGVSIASVLAVTLIAGVVGITWQGAVARRERVRAQQQAATAARASALLVEMFRLSDPDVTRGETITAREMLARGARRVESDFAHDSVLQPLMLLEIGRIYQNLNLADDAERLVRRAVAVWRTRGPSLELAAGVHLLGDIAATRAQYAEAEVHFREALALRRVLHREPNDEVALSAQSAAAMLNHQRKFEQAESLYRDALTIERRLHGARSAHVASTLYALAVTFHDRGNFDDAEPLFREAVAIYRGVPNDRDPVAATARLNLASVLLFRQRYDEAEPLFQEAVTLRRAIYPPGHRATVEALSGLGALRFNTSRFREAEAVLREALETGTRTHGAAHPAILQVKQILGAVLTEQGRYPEADSLLSDALTSWMTTSADMPVGFLVRILRGEARLAAGRLGAAAADFDQAVVAGRRVLGPVHAFVALAIRGRARVEAERGALAAAEAGFREALGAFGSGMRPTHHYLLGTRRALAETLARRGELAEADAILREVIPRLRETLVKGHVELGRALQAHGDVRLRLGDAASAVPLFREALVIRRAALGPDHWHVAETESALGAALAALERHDEARPLLTSAYERLMAQRGANDRRTRDARQRLSR